MALCDLKNFSASKGFLQKQRQVFQWLKPHSELRYKLEPAYNGTKKKYILFFYFETFFILSVCHDSKCQQVTIQ